MAFTIDQEKCLGCGACESECPVEAISAADDGKYVINADLCIDCGSCVAACPVEAPQA